MLSCACGCKTYLEVIEVMLMQVHQHKGSVASYNRNDGVLSGADAASDVCQIGTGCLVISAGWQFSLSWVRGVLSPLRQFTASE